MHYAKIDYEKYYNKNHNHIAKHVSAICLLLGLENMDWGVNEDELIYIEGRSTVNYSDNLGNKIPYNSQCYIILKFMIDSQSESKEDTANYILEYTVYYYNGSQFDTQYMQTHINWYETYIFNPENRKYTRVMPTSGILTCALYLSYNYST